MRNNSYRNKIICRKAITANAAVLMTIMLLSAAFTACRPSIGVLENSNRQYVIGSGKDTLQDPAMLSLTAGFRDSLNKVMNEQLVYNLVPMTKELPEGNLGNFCADVWQKAAVEICSKNHLPAPSFAVFNHGGLRSALPAGYLTIRNVFELMPFENELVICSINRAGKDSLLNIIAKKGGAPIAGIRIQIHEQQTTAVQFLNSSVTDDSLFTVVTSDYLASGNDGFSIFKSGKTESLHIKLRDVLLKELTQLGSSGDTLNIQKDGRITKN